MRRLHAQSPTRENPSGFSLLEVLVTITLIVAMLSLILPGWHAVSRARARQAATGIVMESLELGRNAAITGKHEVWVIFRHRGGTQTDSLRILAVRGSAASPLGGWQLLPPGISFQSSQDSLMKAPPPSDVLASALNGQAPAPGEIFGAVMFQRSGRIGIPLPGGPPLVLQLDGITASSPGLITLSRATGRATCK